MIKTMSKCVKMWRGVLCCITQGAFMRVLMHACAGLPLIPMLDNSFKTLQPSSPTAEAAFIGYALDRELLAAVPGLLVDTDVLGREICDRQEH